MYTRIDGEGDTQHTHQAPHAAALITDVPSHGSNVPTLWFGSHYSVDQSNYLCRA